MRSVRYLTILALMAILCLQCWAAEDSAPLPFVPGSWTLVLLPDTQRYSQDFPETFVNQTKWIVEKRDKRNVAFVLHEGDITNRATEREWENARNAISMMDGKVPYALVPGNHDYTGVLERITLMSHYFPVEQFRSNPAFGGVYERTRIENSYHFFTAGGRDWVVIALETFPRDGVLRWADKVLKKYPNHLGIVVTHAYLYNDNTRYDHSTRTDQKWSPHGNNYRPGCNDGEEIWQKLVSPNPNMAFVFCGHVLGDGAGRLTSTGLHGNTVHQILLNCQSYPDGGSGYLGLVEFLPGGKNLQFRTYSTTMDKYMTDDDHQFTLRLPTAQAE